MVAVFNGDLYLTFNYVALHDRNLYAKDLQIFSGESVYPFSE